MSMSADESAARALDVDDLTALPVLDEAAIGGALALRFARGRVYTNTGAILLAVNPFAKLEGLYDRGALADYLLSFEARRSAAPAGAAAAAPAKLPPHIYQVAGEAYRALVFGAGGASQSILVSGESGSGKTESTKFLMEYLAQAGDMDAQRRTSALSATQRRRVGVAGKVLQTNILLESLGNARTLRNDNSSRFGKFIKLHFTPGGRLTGASIQTYLLEKVRLVSQSAGERNYHVFYEMARGASPAERARWLLDPPANATAAAAAGGSSGSAPDEDALLKHYRYLNQSACFRRRDGVDDVHMFRRVAAAMEEVGFTRREREGAFDLLAALLHLGNLTFAHDDTGEGARGLGMSQLRNASSSNSSSSSSSSDLAPDCLWSRDAAASLLAVDAMQLERALSVRRIRAGTDFVSVKLSSDQANNARDALAKALYGRLFDWMVSRMNEFLSMDERGALGASHGAGPAASASGAAGGGRFIGILDIFGFEVFPRNSFEQLCINFANETLQQQFNDFVFKMEQREYEEQGVAWQYVAFPDNQDCVQLISARPAGLLPLIDDECLVPRGSDATLASKLYRACAAHERFRASRIQQARGQFTILHYAGPVEYLVEGFLDKNKDVLHQEAVDLLVYSPRPGSFTKTLCEGMAQTSGGAGGAHASGHGHNPRSRAKSSPRVARGGGNGGNGNGNGGGGAGANGKHHGRGASVGLQFKEQLATLLETLRETEPHYVRCLKPNDDCAAGVFDRERVRHQLRCSGVLEAVRVSRAGFPIRVPLHTFVGRYFSLRPAAGGGDARNPLLQLKQRSAAARGRLRLGSSFVHAGAYSSSLDGGDDEENRRIAALVADEARALLRDLLPLLPQAPPPVAASPEGAPTDREALAFVAAGAQMGRSKLFLKKRAYEQLEQLRARRLRSHMERIFCAMLAFSARARFLRLRRAVVRVQRAFRGRRRAAQRRVLALALQSAFRGARQRRRFLGTLRAVRVLQCRFRFRRRVAQRREREQREREREREQREQEREREQREREREQREQEREREQQARRSPPPPAPAPQFADDSNTASDSSSEAASSLTSNDIEGSASSSGYSDDGGDYFYGGDGLPPGGPSALTPVHELGRVSTRPKAQSGGPVDSLGPLGPQAHARASRVLGGGGGPPLHSQSHPQMLGPGGSPLPLHPRQGGAPHPHHPHGAHPLRKSSFRSTRTSRAVALPRLDVVQQTQWVNDEDRFSCHICNKRFSMFKRKHHCRACGEVICHGCSLYHRIQSRSMRVCVSCVAFHSLESPTSTASAPSSATAAAAAASRGFSTRLRGYGSGASAASNGAGPSSSSNHHGGRKRSSGESSSGPREARSSTLSSGLWLNAWPEPPYPEDEDERLAVLRELNIRALALSGKFNMYCEVAAKTMKCPIAYVSIIEEDEQVLVANIGMAHAALPRELSFCAHTICQPSVLVVLDTKADERFRENPMVRGDRKGAVKIRYYAGATIFSRDGHALGTVAVLDTKPRRAADQEHIGMLQHLSFLASEKMTQSAASTAAQADSDSEFL